MGQEDARVGALLKEAVALHQGGRLDEAAARYRQVLAISPRQFDALHLLGVIRARPLPTATSAPRSRTWAAAARRWPATTRRCA
jgi:hypothetical protein